MNWRMAVDLEKPLVVPQEIATISETRSCVVFRNMAACIFCARGRGLREKAEIY